jgi:hypothetical protein
MVTRQRALSRVMILACVLMCVFAPAVAGAQAPPPPSPAQGEQAAVPPPPPGSPVQGAQAAVPPPGSGEQPGIIQRIINTIQATVYFPAKTFQLAVEGAARATFTQQIREMRAPLAEVLGIMHFSAVAMDGGVAGIAANMTKAAVPLWGLSLALMLLAVIARQATSSGYGTGQLGEELVKWFCICLASGNAYSILLKVHDGFGALTNAALGGTGAADGLVDKLLLVASPTHVVVQPELPLLILIVGVVIALVITLTLALAYTARVAMLFALAAIAPLCVACEGMPPLRFVFRDWLGMYLKVELIGVLNAVILTTGGTLLATLKLNGGGLVGLAGAVGLAAALIAINVSVFQQVFGTAVSIAGRVGEAVGSVVALATGVGMFGATGGFGGLAASGSALGSGGGNAALGGGEMMGALPAPGESMTGAASGSSTGSGSADYAGPGSSRSGARAQDFSPQSQTPSRAFKGGGASGSWSASGTTRLPSEGALRATALAHVMGQATGSKLARAAAAGGWMGDQVARRAEQAVRDEGTAQRETAGDFGARSAHDRQAVAQALAGGVGGMTHEQTQAAATKAAPFLRDMAERMGGTGPVTHALGADDFGGAAAAVTHAAGQTSGWIPVGRDGGLGLAQSLAETPTDSANWSGMQFADYGRGLEIAQRLGRMEDATAWSWRMQNMRTLDPSGSLTSDFVHNVRNLDSGFTDADVQGALRSALSANAHAGGASVEKSLSNIMLHSPARTGRSERKAGGRA